MILLKSLILPSTLMSISAMAGLVLLCQPSTRRWGTALSGAAFAAYVIFSSGPIAYLLLGHLEYQFAAASPSERMAAHVIVVLAAHAEQDPDIPLSSRVNDAAAFRLLEALILYHETPGRMLVVSGGGMVPVLMREVLIEAGVQPDRMQVDVSSDSTAESAQYIASRLGPVPVLLVTSAGHMPRALGVFRKAGMIPRAAPTHYVTKRNWLAIQYFPSPVYLAYSDWAVSEYAALFWYWVKGYL